MQELRALGRINVQPEVNSTKTKAVAGGAKAPHTALVASLLEGAAVEARRSCRGAPPLAK